MANNKATDTLSYTWQKNISIAGSGPINILAKPSVARCLGFLLWSPINEMLRFQSLPLHACRRPQYSSPSSRFPSHSLYKEGVAPFPKPSSTVGVPSKVALPPRSSLRSPVERERHSMIKAYFYLCLKVPSKGVPPPGSSTGPLWRELHFSRSFLYVILGGRKCRSCPNSCLSLNVSGKWAPLQFSTMEPPVERVAPFQILLLHVSYPQNSRASS